MSNLENFFKYVMHPSLIASAAWGSLQLYSFWICLFIAILSILMFGFGFKKFGKYVPFSMVVYGFIKFVGSAF